MTRLKVAGEPLILGGPVLICSTSETPSSGLKDVAGVLCWCAEINAWRAQSQRSRGFKWLAMEVEGLHMF